MVALESTCRLQSEKQIPFDMPYCMIVPPTNEQTSYKYLQNFNPTHVRRQLSSNIRILNEVNTGDLNSTDRLSFLRIKSFLNTTWQRYKGKLEEINSGDNTDFNEYPFIEENSASHTIKEREIHTKQLTQYFDHELKRVNKPTIAISETHATTSKLVEVVKDQNPEAHIGMFVFDTHADTIPNIGDVLKSSVVDSLVTKHGGKSRLVDQLMLIGEPDELASHQIGQMDDPYHPRYQSCINVLSEEDLYDLESNSLTFSLRQLKKNIENQFVHFSRDHISHVLLSFDIDVLKTGVIDYTAMEYNPFHALLFLSTLDLSQFDNPYELFFNLTHDNECPHGSTILIEPKMLGGRGLSLDYIDKAMQYIQYYCGKSGIQYGAPVHNSQVIGDIVEFQGPDYHNLTKKAIISVAKNMYPKTNLLNLSSI